MAKSLVSMIPAGRLFNDLLFRRRECVFFASDLLHLNGEDLRGLPLVERKENGLARHC
jgi:hypothetical protein